MDAYIEKFKSPGSEYYPVVMWFWNDEIFEEEITFQLEQFKSKSITQFFVHPLHGFKLDYLSERFFELIRYTVAEAKRLGMKFWIYDEYAWPSGQLGGKIIETEEWAKARSLTKTEHELRAPGQRLKCSFPGDFISASVLKTDGRFSDASDRVRIEDGAAELDAQTDDEKIVIFSSEPYKVVLSSNMWGKYTKNIGGMNDLLNKEAARIYLERTYQRYKDEIGDEFGKTVMGSFTDEIYPTSPFEMGAGRTPWTPGFEKLFEKRWGYDIVPHLGSLFSETRTTKDMTVKEHYWELLKEIYFDSFVEPLSDFCRKNGLKLTGHFVGAGSYGLGATQIFNIWQGLRYFDYPGLDTVTPMLTVDNPGYQMLIHSTLNTIGKYYKKDRILCEAFSGSGWSITLEEMKRVINKLILSGTNMLQYMGAYYSLDSGRKLLYMGYPPSHSYNNPIFEFYGDLGRYTAGISYLSAVTKTSARVLVFSPLASARQSVDANDFMLENYTKQSYSTRYLDETLEKLFDSLMRLGIGYDFVDECISQEAIVDKNKKCVSIKGYEYDCVILPWMKYLRSETYRLYEEMLAAGIKIILIGDIPSGLVDTGKRLKVSGPVRKESVGSIDVYETASVCQTLIIPNYIRQTKINRAIPNYGPAETEEEIMAISTDDLRLTVDRLLSHMPRPLGFSSQQKVYLMKRENRDIDVCFIVNDEACDSKAMFAENLNAEFYDPFGEKLSLNSEGGKASLTLRPYSMAVAVSKKSEACQADLSDFTAESVRSTEIKEVTFRLLEDNALLPKVYLRYRDIDWRESSFEEYISTTIGQPLLELNEEYEVKLVFEIKKKIKPLFLNLETADVMEARLNGERLDVSGKTRIWGVNNHKSDISDRVITGENVLLLKCRVPDFGMLHLMPYCFISGDFAVADGAVAGTESVNTGFGDLQTQGYPYYTGKSEYSFEFEIVSDCRRAVIAMESECPLEVTINNEKAGRLLWRPFELDITEYVKAGKNTCRIVMTNYYSNLFSYHKPAGINSIKLKQSFGNN